MTGPHGKSTHKHSRRELFQAVMTLLRRKMQQVGYTPVVIEQTCAAWERFCQIAKPQIRSVQAYAAAMEYAAILRLRGGQITQRAVAERYMVSQASVARLHPRILNCLTEPSPSSIESSRSTPPPPHNVSASSVSSASSAFSGPTKISELLSASATSLEDGMFGRMSEEEQSEELARLQSLPMVRERWGALLLRSESVAALEQRDLREFSDLVPPLFSALCVRPRRPSDPEAVVLVWMDLSRRRILGWFPTDVTQMAHLWELSLRLVMERPLYGMPRRPVDVVLPAVTPFDGMARWLSPLDIHLTPLDRQELVTLESAILGSLCEAPYSFVEENSARYREDREVFFSLAARVAMDLGEWAGEELCLWGRSGELGISLYPEPVGPCVGQDILSALWKARNGTNKGGTWWFAWNRGGEGLLCWTTQAATLGGYLATHLERRGLRLSQRAQLARLVEQLLRFDERNTETLSATAPTSPISTSTASTSRSSTARSSTAHSSTSRSSAPTVSTTSAPSAHFSTTSASSEGRVIWEMRFQRGAVLSAALRRHLFEEGYEIAHARAFPMLCVRELTCGLLPFTEYLWPAVNGFLADWDTRCGALLREQRASLALDVLPAENKEHPLGFASLLSLG